MSDFTTNALVAPGLSQVNTPPAAVRYKARNLTGVGSGPVSGINLPRLLIGGLAAGFVINVGEFILNGLILADDMEALRSLLGLNPLSALQLAAGSGIAFVYGIALIWIYVAIRPRFGPGPMTAVIAGLTFWFIVHVLFTATILANGMFTPNLTLISITWGAFEDPIAALVGASLYREDERRVQG